MRKSSHILMTAITFSAFITSSPVWANWYYQEHGSAFDSKKTHLALASSGKYAFGLRCTNTDDLTFIFITPEQADADTTQRLNALSPEILARIDQNEILTLGATTEIADGNLTLFGDSPSLLAHQIKTANSSVSIAARILGNMYHEIKFNVRGSTATVSKLMNLCGITIP